MNIGYDGNFNWPLCIRGNDNKDYQVTLKPGDGLIYMGYTNPHWRDNQDRVSLQAQAFFHYVNQIGPFSNAILDLAYIPAVVNQSYPEHKGEYICI